MSSVLNPLRSIKVTNNRSICKIAKSLFTSKTLEDEKIISENDETELIKILRKIGTEKKIVSNLSVNCRSSYQRCSVNKAFLEISQSSQENTCARVSFLISQSETARKVSNLSLICVFVLRPLLLPYGGGRTRVLTSACKTNRAEFTDWMYLSVGIYMFKVNNRNTRAMCEICSKLTIKTPE